MGYERILNAEINAELDRLASAGQQWVANWITHKICGTHEDDLKGEAAFWRHGAYCNTRDAVRRQINIRAEDKEEPDKRQPMLPGYHHLHQYYVVKRRGVGDVGIPIHDMTDREIDEKVLRYESMSVACRDHADELRLFKAQRAAQRRKSRRGKAA